MHVPAVLQALIAGKAKLKVAPWDGYLKVCLPPMHASTAIVCRRRS